MKVLAEELKTITYLGEKTENDITFTVPIEKEVTINDKKSDTCRIKYKYCDCFLQYMNLLQHKFWWKIKGIVFKYLKIF